MKKIIIMLGFCTFAVTASAQNQLDSIHIVLVENQNGVSRVLDTIVPLSQQQALFTWMQANGWDAPPPPPPPGAPPVPMTFEREIIIEGDSGQIPGQHQRMMFIHHNGDSMPAGGHPTMIMIEMSDDSMMPPPPGCHMKVMGEPGKEGDVMIMRAPMPPHPPGSTVEVNVQHKDTVINGVKHTMIIRTEKIILPEGVQAPPAPPVPPSVPKAPAPPQPKQSADNSGQQKALVVYPNPTNSVISVEFDVNAKEKTTLRVVDMNGKTVYSEEIVENDSKHVKREIDLSGKSKGAYTVEVQTGKKVVAERIVLQ